MNTTALPILICACERRYRPESADVKHQLCPVCAFYAGFQSQTIWEAYVAKGYEELNDRLWMDMNAETQAKNRDDACGWCRYPFVRSEAAKIQVYCSPECGDEANRARSREYSRKKRAANA